MRGNTRPSQFKVHASNPSNIGKLPDHPEADRANSRKK